MNNNPEEEALNDYLDGWGEYHAKFGLTPEQADTEYDGRDA